jgi:hypothetical protein
MDSFGELLPKTARFTFERTKFLLGVGMVENAFDETMIIEAIPAEQIWAREPILQAKAKASMPRICFPQVDVLIIEQMGKNISGSGFDPNITGRNCRGTPWEAKPAVQKIAVLGLTPETHGNATGVGGADVITMRLFKEIDLGYTYANVITSTYLDGAAIPMIMNTDEEAIRLAVKTCVRVKPEDTKIVRIRTTLELAHIQVSEPLMAEVRANPAQFEILSEPAPLAFDANGVIRPMHAGAHGAHGTHAKATATA